MQYEYDRYVCTTDKIRDKINEYGVAIVPNVLDKKEIKAMKKGAFELFEHITQNLDTPFKEKDKNTWKELAKLSPLHSMLYQHYSLGHAQYIWDLRQNPKIVNIFASIWNVKQDELLVSFDGLAFHVPHEITNKGFYRGNKWFHTDQCPKSSEFKCIQSWITAYDVNEGDATLSFLEKSNSHHHELKTRFNNTTKDDWYKVNDEEYKYFTETLKCKEMCIKCPAGSMVFFDSRTLHCGKEPDKDRKKENFRNIAYICMLPRKTIESPKILSKKQEAFNEMRMTSHWANRCKLFPKNPRIYDKTQQEEIDKLVEIGKPKLTDLGKKLAGFE